MDLEKLPISAKIELLSTEEGGREALLLGPVSFRPNHNFFGENDREMCMGAIELGEGQSVAPGEAIEVNMVLWVWPSLAREIHNGRRWRLQEGAKLVGWGTVLSTAGF